MTKKIEDSSPVDFGKNLAGNTTLAAMFMDRVAESISSARDNRITLEEKWLDDLKDWSCVLKNGEGYQGRSNVYVPELHNQIESTVEKTMQALFPNSDYLYCVDMRNDDKEKAQKICNAIKYELEEKNDLSVRYADFERQRVLIGTSVYKGGFVRDMVDIFVKNDKGKPVKKSVPKWYGAKWDVVDMFRWYIYPETSNLNTCELTFEDQFMSKERVKDSGLYMNLDQVTEIDQQFRNHWIDIERLAIDSLWAAAARRKTAVLLTEVWTSMPIAGVMTPVMGVIANYRTVVRLIKNPFWFQTNPYAASVYLNRPGGLFYGYSLPDRLRTQQGLMNDLTNHTMDSLTFSLNPIMIIDPALAGDVNSMKVQPGAKWLGSPEGIKDMQFPDVSGSGLRAIQEVRGQIAQFSDNTPGIAPQLQGKSRSATQASLVQAAVTVRQRVQARGQEVTVLQPMCRKTHIMLQQFRDAPYQIRLQGPADGQWIVQNVDPSEDLVGDVEWSWRGSTEEEKNAVRSQQLIAFYNSALQTQSVLPPGEIDLAALFRRVAKEAFQLRDLEEIFKSERDKKTVDPEIENIAIMEGQDVPINGADNDEEHMKVVMRIVQDKKSDDEQKLNAIRHYERHELQDRAKKEIAATKARVQALQAVQATQGPPGQPGQQGPPQGAQDGRSIPQPPGPGEGNQIQAMSSPASVFSSIRGSVPQ